MPHTHEGGVSHEHEGGDLTHDHRTAAYDRDPDVAGPAGPVVERERDYDRTVAPRRTEPHVHDRDYPAGYVYGVRGGFSLGSILTGMAVALGAMLLLAALIGGIVAAAGLMDGTVPTTEEVTQLGWGAAIGLIVAQFVAYVWGGYTAGRMARGSGWLNGLLVPVAAIVFVVLIGALVRAMGAEAGVDVAYGTTRFPLGLEAEEFAQMGAVAGIGSLIAMFVGAILGGIMGARWHDKLEATHGIEEPHLRAA